MVDIPTILAALVGVALLGVLIIAARKPGTFTVERSIVINAPAERIFAHINNLRAMNAWNPFVLGDPGDKTIATLAEAKAANIGVFAYGNFITALINFLILAFVIFMIVRSANKMMKRDDAAGTPEDVLLLREIRDSVKK